MTGIRFTEEKLSVCWEELLPLTCQGYAEVGPFTLKRWKPDIRIYMLGEEAKRVACHVMRVRGMPRGYSIWWVGPHQHHADEVWAVQDVLWVAPECRGSLVARFIRWSDRKLKAAGVRVVTRSVKVARDYHAILEGLGYFRHEISYLREL